MVIAARDDEGVVGQPAARSFSARVEHQHLAGPSSSSLRSPPSLAEEKEAFHSRRLHNFSFPSTSLIWRNQRLLRCSNLPNAADPGPRQLSPPAVAAGHNHHGSPASGKRPISSSSPSREKSRADDSSSSAAAVAAAAVEVEAARPWNLRTRRAACNAPAEDGMRRRQALVSVPSRLAMEKNCRPAPKAAGKQSKGLEKNTKRREFLITLTKEEIEEDYRVLKGTKPPRRPKRRPRNVQQELDFLFPGFGLSEITLDAYKIDE